MHTCIHAYMNTCIYIRMYTALGQLAVWMKGAGVMAGSGNTCTLLHQTLIEAQALNPKP